MSKYVDSEKLIAELTRMQFDLNAAYLHPQSDSIVRAISLEYDEILSLVDSLQQDDAQVDKMLCSQIWWEEQGWIMIPPDATIEGIDSLLKQVKKKLQQKQLAEILEKFISDFIDKKDSENQGKWCEEDIIEAMKSSFDLGLNARKDG